MIMHRKSTTKEDRMLQPLWDYIKKLEARIKELEKK